jgi:ketosteroid isomerase-like protein
MKPLLRLLAAILFLLLANFAAGRQAPARKSSSNEADKIRALEGAMMAAGEREGALGYMSFYADGAVELSAGVELLVGKAAITKTMAFLDDKNNRLTWTPGHVDVARSGDLAYTYGTYEFHSIGKDGRPAVEYGKCATVVEEAKRRRLEGGSRCRKHEPRPQAKIARCRQAYAAIVIRGYRE